MVGYRDDPPWNTFSNTGNIPTLHQPTVTVTTVTHTHWLPTVADPHYLPQVSWFAGIYSCWLYSYYDIAKCKTLQNALGMKTECTRKCIYITWNISLRQHSCVVYAMECEVEVYTVVLQPLSALVTWQSSLLLSAVGTQCTAKCVCVSPIQWHGISAY